jgi:hypothetical protein
VPSSDTAAGAPSEDLADDAYRLLSIDRTSPPTGSEGRDWMKYRITQGTNLITGYRRGSLATVTEDVKKVVDGLNERRMVRRGRVDLTPARPATAPPSTDGEDAA